MAWGSVTWNTGDLITETKMNQMVENTAITYSGNVAQTILTAGWIYDSDPSTTVACSVEVDGVVMSAYTQEGALDCLDYDISSLADDALYDIEFITESTTQTFKFYKTLDMNYLSLWMRFNVTEDVSYEFQGVTIIAHRDALT